MELHTFNLFPLFYREGGLHGRGDYMVEVTWSGGGGGGNIGVHGVHGEDAYTIIN